MAETSTPSPELLALLHGPGLLRLLHRVLEHSYNGGVHGTCYECPFASPPLDRQGREAAWHDISNDPTEAWFRCSLPGRDNAAVEWGEYAPCTEEEWWAGVLASAGVPLP